MNSGRLFTFVDLAGPPSTVRHIAGRPAEDDSEPDDQNVLARAQVLVIEQKPDGVFLYRLTDSGEYAGDTWHESIEAAKDQAVFEYGESLGTWQPIPASIEDAHEFAVSQLKNQ